MLQNIEKDKGKIHLCTSAELGKGMKEERLGPSLTVGTGEIASRGWSSPKGFLKLCPSYNSAWAWCMSNQ